MQDFLDGVHVVHVSEGKSESGSTWARVIGGAGRIRGKNRLRLQARGVEHVDSHDESGRRVRREIAWQESRFHCFMSDSLFSHVDEDSKGARSTKKRRKRGQKFRHRELNPGLPGESRVS